ncbi:MAG TPA: DNA polymerase III subunit delta' C-terminal domain-containing protein [Candidatus Kryptonia bacterium]
MSWDKVIGQERVKGLLKQLISSARIPGALLFDGPEGIGKDATAIELAKTLNCERGANEACEECTSCKQAAALQHPNIHLVFPLPRGEGETKDDGPLDKLDEKAIKKIREELAQKARDPYHAMSVPKAQIIKISSIREVIREDALSLFQRGRRVVIVMQAHEVGTESANALLKVLEEPSPGTLFILTTSKRSALLPTIVSRCQTMRFDLLSEKEIAEALVERHSTDRADAKLKARLSGGSYSKAVELLETETLEIRDEALDILRDIAVSNYSLMASRALKALETKDAVRTETLLKMVQIWLRDAAVMHFDLPEEIINQDRIDVLTRMSKSFDDTRLVEAANIIDTAIAQIDGNVNLGLLFVNLMLNLSGLLNKNREAENA